LHDRFRYLIHFIFFIIKSRKSKSKSSSRIYDDYVEDEMRKNLASINCLSFFSL